MKLPLYDGRNLYGCPPCPACGSVYVAAFRRTALGLLGYTEPGLLQGGGEFVIHCSDCDLKIPARERDDPESWGFDPIEPTEWRRALLRRLKTRAGMAWLAVNGG